MKKFERGLKVDCHLRIVWQFDKGGTLAFNDCMFYGGLHQVTSIALLCSQFLLVVVGGPLMVQCQGSNDHVAIELAHANPCGAGESDTVWSAEDCVDNSLTQLLVLRQEDRTAFAAISVLLVYQLVELPELRVSPSGVTSIPVFKPDSAESLARSVILLI